MSLSKDALTGRGVDLKALLDAMLAGRIEKVAFARLALMTIQGGVGLPDSTIGSTSYAMWKDIEADGVTPTKQKDGSMAVVAYKPTIASGKITEDTFVEAYRRAMESGVTGGRAAVPAAASGASNGNGAKRQDMPANSGQAAAAAGANRPPRPPVSPNIVEAVREVFTKVEDGDVPQNPQNAYVMFWDALPNEVKVGHTTTVIADTLKALFASDAQKAAGIIATLPEDARTNLLDTIGLRAPEALQTNLQTAVTAAYHLDSNRIAGYLSGWDAGVQRLVDAKGADGGFDWAPSDDDKAEGLLTHVKTLLRTLGRALEDEVKAAEAARLADGGRPAVEAVLWDTAKEFFPEAVRPFVGRTWASLPAEVQHQQIAEARAEAEAAEKAAAETPATDDATSTEVVPVEPTPEAPTEQPRRGRSSAS